MTIIPLAARPGVLEEHSEPTILGTDELVEQQAGAQERVAARATSRATNEQALGADGGMAAVNTPDQIARRLDRVARYYLDAAPAGAGGPAGIDLATALTHARSLTHTDESIGRTVEAIINNSEIIGVRYLSAGVRAARTVGRVNVARGRAAGTGFLVAPNLLLTNHHVLPDDSTARRSAVEFDYQDDADGRPLPVQSFDLDPDTLYLADKDLDFALVVVTGSPEQLAPFGFNRLTDAQGTVVIGEFTTIVQHPGGGKKMVSLRENKLVDILERYLHYSTDTEPGSSGSPVFNDQWEVVALHHASARAVDHPEFGGIVNEGIRISRIIAWLREQHLTPAQSALLVPVIGAGSTAPTVGASSPPRSVSPESQSIDIQHPVDGRVDIPVATGRPGQVTVTVTVCAGPPAPAPPPTDAPPPEPDPSPTQKEAEQ
ncbi:serine protease [Gordonia sp. ABSL1-1]|uniref:trypsin-like serine peptidase n=1 Tax=Gordonia sp. ABSL1-1 TaxID=3053923 RepID=UPI0025735A37|nr:serine protease [Gordonia sp. ABSL1-1]MDL9935955.1 serine protease [Gordonia sp. ABSL1-1]